MTWQGGHPVWYTRHNTRVSIRVYHGTWNAVWIFTDQPDVVPNLMRHYRFSLFASRNKKHLNQVKEEIEELLNSNDSVTQLQMTGLVAAWIRRREARNELRHALHGPDC